jgi:hypothetical protein
MIHSKLYKLLQRWLYRRSTIQRGLPFPELKQRWVQEKDGWKLLEGVELNIWRPWFEHHDDIDEMGHAFCSLDEVDQRFILAVELSDDKRFGSVGRRFGMSSRVFGKQYREAMTRLQDEAKRRGLV